MYEHGIAAILSIVDKPMPLEEAMDTAPALLADAAERLLRIVQVVHTLINGRAV